MDRLASVPRYVRLYFGIPIILLAVAGGWRLYVRGARDRATLATLGWTAACMIFLVIGIVTPVDMRHYLAAIPAFAVAGGAGASWLWTAGTDLDRSPSGCSRWAAVTGMAASSLSRNQDGMAFIDRISEQLTAAMRAKDTVRLGTLRMAKAAL